MMADKYWMDVLIRYECIRWSRAWFQRLLRPRRHHIDCTARLVRREFYPRRTLRSLPLRRPLVRGHDETSQVAWDSRAAGHVE